MILFENSPYVIGVTGHMDIRAEEEALLKERLGILFRFLLWKRTTAQSENPWLPKLLALLKSGVPGEQDTLASSAYERALRAWPTLEKTPLVLLTSMAPGGDMLGADVALDLRDNEGLNIHVIAPLPMHHDIYEFASTFKDRDPAAAAAKLQRYRDLRSRIGEENTFCVRMASDVELGEAQFREKCIEDRDDANDSSQRHARYRAAGEYVTAYCHLLLAIWDHHHNKATSEGVAAIVEARRGNLQYGLLPGNFGLNMPHGGPALCFYTHRVENQESKKSDAAARFRYSHAAEERTKKPPTQNPDEIKRRHARLQLEELSLLGRIARNLEDFNRIAPPTDEVQKEMDSFMVLKTGTGDARNSLAAVLGENADSDLWRGLRGFAKLRKKASKENQPLTRRGNWTLVVLFWLTLTAASLGHLFVEWHPQDAKNPVTVADLHATQTAGSTDAHNELQESENAKSKEAPIPPDAESVNESAAAKPNDQASEQKGATGEKTEVHEESKPPLSGDKLNEKVEGHHHEQDWWRPGWGAAAWLIALGAIFFFALRRSEHSIERAHDYRAFAEGMRVQLFWNLAGLGKSVPANYMQRQRGELDWIRGVIRAASMPYDWWRYQLERQTLMTQALAVRCVFENWICEQESYFDKSSGKKLFELHSWHKLGAILAVAGLLGTIVSASSALADSHEPLFWLRPNWWIGAILTALFVFLTAYVARRHRKILKEDPLHAHHHAPALGNSPWSVFTWLKIKIFELLDHWVITTPSHPGEHLSRSEDLRRMALNGLTYCSPALALVFSAATAAALIAIFWETSPNVTIWTSIFLGIYLVGGAMCIAWTEKQLDSELAYQYGTMAPLFTAARLRLKPLVDKLEHLAEVNDEENFKKTQKEIRDVLYELGQEALDENAEWLILHRARPLEPVMAG